MKVNNIQVNIGEVHAQTISGSGCFSGSANSFTFHPDCPKPGTFKRYRKQGSGIRTSDGTFEFVERNTVRSRAEVIKMLSHGRLTKTLTGEYLLTIRIPVWEERPASVIAEDAMVAMDALQAYIWEEAA
ncbi:MAG: hypothetical protein J6W52_06830 [Bacteroidaceae bacterium]|nr:hypothetical protein [Bacteroidaceae bacterium]